MEREERDRAGNARGERKGGGEGQSEFETRGGNPVPIRDWLCCTEVLWLWADVLGVLWG
jgi:hypothetical protein